MTFLSAHARTHTHWPLNRDARSHLDTLTYGTCCGTVHIPEALLANRICNMCLNETYSEVWGISYSELSETGRCFIAIAFQLCSSICHQEGLKLNGTQRLLVCADSVPGHTYSIRGRSKIIAVPWTCIRKAPDSKLGRVIDFPDSGCFQSLQANAAKMPWNKALQPPCRLLLTLYDIIFDTVLALQSK